jgi:hypothetical protein
MIEHSGHDGLDRNTLAWLRCLADPAGIAPRPAEDLVPAQVDGLILAAIHHSVLPAVVRRLRGDERLAGKVEVPAFASEQIAGLAARSLVLAHQGGRVVTALAEAGIPATLVKGPLFARRLYPEVALRPFSDIDVVVPPKVRAESRAVMTGLGFHLVEQEKRAGLDYHEDQWLLEGRKDVLIEIQDDLVHAPSLARMSLSYADLVEAGSGDPAAATSLLMTGAVHGAIGHQFEALRFVVDVCQAARGVAGPIDAGALAAVAGRNRTALAISLALDLAARVFSEPACAELADRLGNPPGRRLCRMLLSPATVLRAQGPTRHRDSWRRKLLREVFKRRAGVDIAA